MCDRCGPRLDSLFVDRLSMLGAAIITVEETVNTSLGNLTQHELYLSISLLYRVKRSNTFVDSNWHSPRANSQKVRYRVHEVEQLRSP